MKLFIEEISENCDDIVCDILSKYLFPRDSGWLQRNKSGLCKGNQVIVEEQLLGDIAHKYAVEKYGPYVASNVGNAGAYFSPVYGKPLKIDINSGRVQLPKFELIATNLERKLKIAYAQLESKLADLFMDISDQILEALSEKKLSFESKSRTRKRNIKESFDDFDADAFADNLIGLSYDNAIKKLENAKLYLNEYGILGGGFPKDGATEYASFAPEDDSFEIVIKYKLSKNKNYPKALVNGEIIDAYAY